MASARTYNDLCGVARGLDVVGERWALLVVRELLLGPKRFTDLSRGLAGASQNVLTQRLRELEDSGVVQRRRLGPPTGAWVYELTEWGAELEPVLDQLGRWGSRAPAPPSAGIGVDALILALKTAFDPLAAGDLNASYELRFDADRICVDVAEGEIELARGSAVDPDAILTTNVATLLILAFADHPIDDALRTGELTVSGDPEAVARLVGAFSRPAPHAESA
ncbi:MAG TPA: winged helix-turn-helix transcriptional regulator [Conexibacter sp.]|jgi:DNA-binding HxlR family transcriptional regulator|nr:winged helix-turn-helix transcriptional regulator [Conexibacter sp.]